jgi:iron complex transport system substrate-binding protein
VTSEQVCERAPDMMIGSWCGKKFQPAKVAARAGWQTIPAVKNGHLYEIKSADILQPGPALFTHALPQLQRIIQKWQNETQEKREGKQDEFTFNFRWRALRQKRVC